MKRFFFFLSIVLFAGLCAPSCTQEIGSDEFDGQEIIQVPETMVQRVSVTATVEDYTPDTKTILGPNPGATDPNDMGKFQWTPGDEINLIFGSGGGEQDERSRFTTSITAPASKATFEGNLHAATGVEEGQEEALKFWGIFPYNAANQVIEQNGQFLVSMNFPAVQTAFDYDNNSWDLGPFGSWGKEQFPYIAQSGNMLLSFKMLGGGLKFYVTTEGITEIRFRGANNETIAGNCIVSMSNGVPSIVSFDSQNSTSEIILRMPQNGTTVRTFKKSEGNTKYFYFLSLPAITFPDGFIITAYTENSCGTRPFTGERPITRKRIGGWSSSPLDNERMVWGDIPPQNNQIAYYATAKLENNAFLASGATEHVYDQSTHRGVVTFSADVTEIDNNAFNGETALTGIVLPETVESIGNYAFKGCTNLAFVKVGAGNDMGSTITFIGEEAFYGCSSLTGVTLPTSLLYLRQLAFGECTALTGEMVIPASLDNCYTNPFYKCTGITSFSGRYATDDGLFLFDTSSNVL